MFLLNIIWQVELNFLEILKEKVLNFIMQVL